MTPQEEELLSLQERAASHPYNEAVLLRRIGEIKAALGIASKESRVKPVAETAEADLSEVETAVVTTKRKR
jgi:hypothetical protein